MPLRPNRRSTTLRLALSAGSAFIFSAAAHGQTWDGGDTINSNWTTAANWNPDGVPANNLTANIHFAGSTRTSPFLNQTQLIASLTFDPSAATFTFTGSQLSVGPGGITNNSTAIQSLALPVSTNPFNSSQVWDAVAGPMTFGGPITLNSSNLTVNGPNSIRFDAAVSGSGTITKAGAGDLLLNATISNTGGLIVNTGTVRWFSSNIIPDTQQITLNGTSVLDLNGRAETIGALTASPDAKLVLPTTSALTLSTSGAFLLTAEIVGDSSASFTKAGAGTLQFGHTVSFAGTFGITGGTLELTQSEFLPSTANLSIAGGSLRLPPFGTQTFKEVTITSGGFTPTNATLFANTYTLGPADITAHLAGSATLLKTGPGTATLANSNTYTGSTTIAAGTLALAASNALPDTSPISIAQGTVLQLNADVVDSCASVTGSGSITLATGSNLSIGIGGASCSFDGQISGAGRLSKVGAGTLTLSGSNTHSGGTQIDGGVVIITADANLGASANPLLLRAGTLRTATTLTLARPIDFTSIGGAAPAIETLATTTLTGSLTGTSGITKTGPGTLILSSTSAAPAALFVSSGDLRLTPGTAVTTTAASTVAAGSTLLIDDALLSGPSLINNGGTITLGRGGRFNGSLDNASGLVEGDGLVTGVLANRAPSEVRIDPGQSLHFAGTAPHSNQGLIDVIGGTAQFDAPLTNSSNTSLIYASSAILRFNGGLINLGSVACSFGATHIFGDIDNRAGGRIVISGSAGSGATFLDDVVNNGSITTSASSAAVFLGSLSGSGSFPGAGTVFLEGDLRPGNSPGLIAFGGDVSFGAAATLVEEIAGTDSTLFDRTTVVGTAFLDGTLEVRLLAGFVPSGITSFNILTAGEVQGRFASVIVPALATLRAVYTGTAVRLTTCAADFNADATLDPDDLADYITAYFAQPPDPAADFDQNTLIDPDDLADYITAFFTGCP